MQSKNIRIEKGDNLHEYMDSNMEFHHKFLDELSRRNKQEIIEKIMELGDPVDICKTPLSIKLIRFGIKFSVDDLILLNNPSNGRWQTLSHWMVTDNDYEFTMDELLLLGNPADNFGETIANYMAYNGHVFSVDEILKLKNTGNNWENLVFWMVKRSNYYFSADDIIALGNPIFDRERGQNLAKFLIERGRIFTRKEKERLCLV